MSDAHEDLTDRWSPMSQSDDGFSEQEEGPALRQEGFWDRQLRARIGQDLRNLFQDALSEPVPDHLNRLLTRIKREADRDRTRAEDYL
jgi:hypothetical protein